MVLLEEVMVEKSMTQETDTKDEVLIIGLEMKSILRQPANNVLMSFGHWNILWKKKKNRKQPSHI